MGKHGRGEKVIIEQAAEGLRGKQFGEAATAGYWDRLWEAEAATLGLDPAGHLPHQLRATIARRVAPPSRVLEAGCGLGRFTVAMHERGYQATGLDWAERTVERLRYQFPNIDFQQGDVRSSPFVLGHFDAVYSPGVCEHFEEGPDAVLKDAYRVLRPGGLAFVSTPHLNILRQRRWRRHEPAGGEFYQYLFTKVGMKRILERIGFEVIDTKPYGVFATMAGEWPSLKRFPIGRAAGLLDLVPKLQELGSTCIWTARKPDGADSTTK